MGGLKVNLFSLYFLEKSRGPSGPVSGGGERRAAKTTDAAPAHPQAPHHQGAQQKVPARLRHWGRANFSNNNYWIMRPNPQILQHKVQIILKYLVNKNPKYSYIIYQQRELNKNVLIILWSKNFNELSD